MSISRLEFETKKMLTMFWLSTLFVTLPSNVISQELNPGRIQTLYEVRRDFVALHNLRNVDLRGIDTSTWATFSRLDTGVTANSKNMCARTTGLGVRGVPEVIVASVFPAAATIQEQSIEKRKDGSLFWSGTDWPAFVEDPFVGHVASAKVDRELVAAFLSADDVCPRSAIIEVVVYISAIRNRMGPDRVDRLFSVLRSVPQLEHHNIRSAYNRFTPAVKKDWSSSCDTFETIVRETRVFKLKIRRARGSGSLVVVFEIEPSRSSKLHNEVHGLMQSQNTLREHKGVSTKRQYNQNTLVFQIVDSLLRGAGGSRPVRGDAASKPAYTAADESEFVFLRLGSEVFGKRGGVKNFTAETGTQESGGVSLLFHFTVSDSSKTELMRWFEMLLIYIEQQ
ncbi:MAG: hypothetical protein GY903_13900 [Fuerstiella sp.]|nr:hypothetical protein [Fuerstiella sp.]MCP4855579.1 hypothetical protein [Fuerstiella sp.]